MTNIKERVKNYAILSLLDDIKCFAPDTKKQVEKIEYAFKAYSIVAKYAPFLKKSVLNTIDAEIKKLYSQVKCNRYVDVIEEDINRIKLYLTTQL